MTPAFRYHLAEQFRTAWRAGPASPWYLVARTLDSLEVLAVLALMVGVFVEVFWLLVAWDASVHVLVWSTAISLGMLGFVVWSLVPARARVSGLRPRLSSWCGFQLAQRTYPAVFPRGDAPVWMIHQVWRLSEHGPSLSPDDYDVRDGWLRHGLVAWALCWAFDPDRHAHREVAHTASLLDDTTPSTPPSRPRPRSRL